MFGAINKSFFGRPCLMALACLVAVSSFSFGQPPLKGIGDREDFSLEMPTPEQLFRPESEAKARERIRRFAAQKKIKEIEFPSDAKVAHAIDPLFLNRPAQVITHPANVVCFRTLYFEDPKTEISLRLWGILEPCREAWRFYGLAITVPVRLILMPPWKVHCRNYDQLDELPEIPAWRPE
jgi:hypothetical protein